MKRRMFTYIFLFIFIGCFKEYQSISMKQFDESLDTMRSICQPKFKVSTETLDNLRLGIFDDNNSDLRCYTKCISQMVGTLTKKGDFNPQRVATQIEIIIPPELQDETRKAFDKCKDVSKNYKDPCDKTYFTTKCVCEYNPAKFKFP